ncbi:MAG: response regulator [Chloroflexi bacterium]|nr:response regulator [Chloroflexota bacterium]
MADYVLIVDDDENVRRLLVDMLNRMDIDSKEAENGAVAFDAISADMPKVVILDLMMPVMDGFSLLTRLQGQSAYRKLPVVLLSAIADNAKHMQNLPGVIAVLRKGRFEASELADLIQPYFEAAEDST